MAKSILGRKLGMTQIFTPEGKRVAVTVVQVGPMVVLQKKSENGKDGYAAIKVGFEDAVKQQKDESIRWRGLTKPDVGVFQKAGIETPRRVVREFRVRESELDQYAVGQTLDHTLFNEGDIIDVIGTSKGRGFAGTMKRHNFHGFNSSHGAHETFRGPGAISSNTFPGRVFKGKKMSGHLGDERVTTQNLKLFRILAEDSLYLIRGSVPGANGGLVVIRPAIKKAAHG